MIARLKKTRFLAVLGSSGTGKSSLVKTGLLSGLELGQISGSYWRIVEFRPGGDPLGKLAEELLKSESSAAKEIKPPDVEIERLKARFKREGPRELIKWCRERHFAPGTNLLLLVDQFEELFRYQNNDQREEAQAFVSLLLESRWPRGVASPEQAQIPIYVTITMRSEYLGACALMLGLPEAINEGIYLAPRMSREQCEEAIVGPALVCGIEIEDRLVTKLLNDMAEFAPWEAQREGKDQLNWLARQADQLPLMQYALNQMWRRANKASQAKKQQTDGKIRLKFDEYLGLERELDSHGDEVYARLGEPLKATAQTVFRAVTSGTTVADAQRRPTKYGELVKICGEGSNDAVAAVIEAFGPRGCQFLTSDVRQTGERLPDHAWIDIAHESLIRQWKLLSTWLEKEGIASHAWQRLKDDAERGGFLYGRRLRDAVEFRDEVKPTARWAERYGGSFDRVTHLITKSEWLKHGLVMIGVVLAIGLLAAGSFVYEQHAEKIQKTIVATQNFELAVNSANRLLKQLSEFVEHGDITINGATHMLRVASEIVDQVKTVESTTKTVALLINLEHTASDIYGELGKYNDAYANAKKAMESAESLRVADPDNPEVLPLLYKSIWRMANSIDYLGGDRAKEQALMKYLEAEELARRVVERVPEATERQRELMFIVQKIGDIRQDLGALEAAIEKYQTALTIVQNLLAKAPQNRVLRRDGANSRRRIGQALSEKGDRDGALEQLRAALEVLTDLAQEDPNDDVVQSNLAANHRDVARVYLQRDDLDAALVEYLLATRIQEGLIAKDPTNATWQFSLASYSTAMGDVLRRHNNLADALGRYQKAYTLRKELATKDPTNPRRQRSLATAAISVADLLKAQNYDLDNAVHLYREAIGILDEARPLYDPDVFKSYIKIGDLLISEDDRIGALTEYKRAQAIARDKAASNTSGSIWQKNLTISQIKIGDLLTSQESSREALESYQQALKIITALAEREPKNPEWSAFVEELRTKIRSLELKPRPTPN